MRWCASTSSPKASPSPRRARSTSSGSRGRPSTSLFIHRATRGRFLGWGTDPGLSPSHVSLVRADAVAERIERRLAVAAVDRLVGHGARPARRELAGEAVAEEIVDDALALRAREPGRDERVRLRDLGAD